MIVKISRQIQYSALKYLSFLLEKNWMDMIILVINFTGLLLSFRLDHAGMDFTLKFEWIQQT